MSCAYPSCPAPNIPAPPSQMIPKTGSATVDLLIFAGVFIFGGVVAFLTRNWLSPR